MEEIGTAGQQLLSIRLELNPNSIVCNRSLFLGPTHPIWLSQTDLLVITAEQLMVRLPYVLSRDGHSVQTLIQQVLNRKAYLYAPSKFYRTVLHVCTSDLWMAVSNKCSCIVYT